MATHSSILAWRIPGTEEPVGLPSTGSHRVAHDCCDLAAAAPGLHCCTQFVQLGQMGATVQLWHTGFSLGCFLLVEHQLQSVGLVSVAHGPSYPMACGIFLDQGLNLCPPEVAGGFLTTGPPGKYFMLLLFQPLIVFNFIQCSFEFFLSTQFFATSARFLTEHFQMFFSEGRNLSIVYLIQGRFAR